MTTFKEFLILNEDKHILSLMDKIQIPSEIPTVKRQSVVRFVERNKNPISVHLADGTHLFFTWDEFKRIQGLEPSAGRKLTVVLQRHPGDKSNNASKIVSCHCDR